MVAVTLCIEFVLFGGISPSLTQSSKRFGQRRRQLKWSVRVKNVLGVGSLELGAKVLKR